MLGFAVLFPSPIINSKVPLYRNLHKPHSADNIVLMVLDISYQIPDDGRQIKLYYSVSIQTLSKDSETAD